VRVPRPRRPLPQGVVRHARPTGQGTHCDARVDRSSERHAVDAFRWGRGSGPGVSRRRRPGRPKPSLNARGGRSPSLPIAPSPTVGLDETGTLELSYGERVFTAVLTPDLTSSSTIRRAPGSPPCRRPARPTTPTMPGRPRRRWRSARQGAQVGRHPPDRPVLRGALHRAELGLHGLGPLLGPAPDSSVTSCRGWSGQPPPTNAVTVFPPARRRDPHRCRRRRGVRPPGRACAHSPTTPTSTGPPSATWSRQPGGPMRSRRSYQQFGKGTYALRRVRGAATEVAEFRGHLTEFLPLARSRHETGVHNPRSAGGRRVVLHLREAVRDARGCPRYQILG